MHVPATPHLSAVKPRKEIRRVFLAMRFRVAFRSCSFLLGSRELLGKR